MDELLLTLGYKYYIDQVKIEINKQPLYLVEAGHKINQAAGQILHYNGLLGFSTNTPPLWSYVTEFGEMYEKFLLSQQQSQQQAYQSQHQMNHSMQGALTINQGAFNNQQAQLVANNHQFNYSQNVSGGLGITNPHAHTAVTSVGIGSSADSYPRAHQGVWGTIKGLFSGE